MHVSDLPERTQDYLKLIYDLSEWGDGDVTSSRLSQGLSQKASTVSEALKRLVAQGLVTHQPYGAVGLTEEGRRLAIMMVRRHRLIEMYLCTHVGYSWDEVHDEAELLEHAVSDLFLQRISDLMGNPTRDPHGDPIPAEDGTIPESSVRSLSEIPRGVEVTVDRISDRDPQLLRYLADHSVRPGIKLRLGEPPYPAMAILELIDSDGTVQLSEESLSAILVVDN